MFLLPMLVIIPVLLLLLLCKKLQADLAKWAATATSDLVEPWPAQHMVLCSEPPETPSLFSRTEAGPGRRGSGPLPLHPSLSGMVSRGASATASSSLSGVRRVCGSRTQRPHEWHIRGRAQALGGPRGSSGFCSGLCLDLLPFQAAHSSHLQPAGRPHTGLLPLASERTRPAQQCSDG